MAREKPHRVIMRREVAKTLSRLKNFVSRVRWNSVDPTVVNNWSMAMPYCTTDDTKQNKRVMDQ